MLIGNIILPCIEGSLHQCIIIKISSFTHVLKIKYIEDLNGDLSKKCSLEYEDIDITRFNFSILDLNTSFLGSIYFNKCDFSNVYLSRSIFGRSFFHNYNRSNV